MVRIAVCISTIHRPEGLRRVLESLGALNMPAQPAEITVVVVNNDPDDPRPQQLIDQLSERFPHRLMCLVEPVRGVSAPRNRALDSALPDHDFIAFLDDDSVATPEWLAGLIEVQHVTGADVVTGPVRPLFDATPPVWIRSGRFFAPRSRPTGTELSHAFTNNVLMSASFLHRTGLRFDPRLGSTGGEDTYFFRCLRRLGGTIVWAEDAVVEDAVPAERTTAGWLIRRHVRTGMNTAWMERDLRPTLVAWPFVGARAACWLVLGVLLFGLGLVSGRATRVRARCWLAWSRGLVLGLLTRADPEYVRDR